MRRELLSAIHIPSREESVKQQWWIVEQLEQIGEEKLEAIIQAAISVRPMGASILCESGEIYASPNTKVGSCPPNRSRRTEFNK